MSRRNSSRRRSSTNIDDTTPSINMPSSTAPVTQHNHTETTTGNVFENLLEHEFSEEITLWKASKDLVSFGLPLIARSGVLIASGIVLPTFISRYNESKLAAFSEIMSIEGLLSAIYVSGAYSVPPLVGMLSRLCKKTKTLETFEQLEKDITFIDENTTALLSATAQDDKVAFAIIKQKLKDFIGATDGNPEKTSPHEKFIQLYNALKATKASDNNDSNTFTHEETIKQYKELSDALNNTVDISTTIFKYKVIAQFQKKLKELSTEPHAYNNIDTNLEIIFDIHQKLRDFTDKPCCQTYSAMQAQLNKLSTALDDIRSEVEKYETKAHENMLEADAAARNYLKLPNASTALERFDPLCSIIQLLRAGITASSPQHKDNKTLQTVRSTIFTFCTGVRDKNHKKMTNALSTIEKLEKSIHPDSTDPVTIQLVEQTKEGINTYNALKSENHNTFKIAKNMILAQLKLDEANRTINSLEVILSNWALSPADEDAFTDWNNGTLNGLAARKTAALEHIDLLPRKLGIIFRQSFLYGLLLGGFAAGGAFLMPPLLALMHQPQNVIDDTKEYLPFASFGYLLDTLYRVQLRFLIGQSIRRTAFFAELLDSLVEIPLFYLFLFHTEMGLKGIALGMALAKITTLIAHSIYVFNSETQKNHDLTSLHGESFIQWPLLKKLIKNGLPISIESFLDTVRTSIVTTFCGLRGTKGLVAMQASGLYATVDGYPLGAIYQAVNTKVGEFQETFNSRNAITYGNAGIILLTAFTLFTLPFALFMPEKIASLLIDANKEVDDFNMAIKFLRIEGIGTAVTASLFALQGGLSGLLDNNVPLVTTLATGLVLNSSLAAIVTFVMKKDEAWIYGSQIIGFFLATVILFARWYQQSQRYYRPGNHLEEIEAPALTISTGALRPLDWMSRQNEAAYTEEDRLLPPPSAQPEMSYNSL